jgi:hypothetical protein
VKAGLTWDLNRATVEELARFTDAQGITARQGVRDALRMIAASPDLARTSGYRLPRKCRRGCPGTRWESGCRRLSTTPGLAEVNADAYLRLVRRERRHAMMLALRIFGTVCVVLAVVLGVLHVHEDNSPLVWGLGLMGISSFISPAILGWAASADDDDVPVCPGCRPVVQSVLFPVAGLALTVWGLLGEAGVVDKISFDGPPQHCRSCDATWLLEGKRDGRAHYVDYCERCATFPGLLEEVESMLGELREQVKKANTTPAGDMNSVEVRYDVRTWNTSTIRFASHETNHALETGLEGDHSRVLVRSDKVYAPLGLRLDVSGGREGEGDAYRLDLHLYIHHVESATTRHSVRRTKTIRVSRGGYGSE